MRLAAYAGVSATLLLCWPMRPTPVTPADNCPGFGGPGHRGVPESTPSESQLLRRLCISLPEQCESHGESPTPY